MCGSIKENMPKHQPSDQCKNRKNILPINNHSLASALPNGRGVSVSPQFSSPSVLCEYYQ